MPNSNSTISKELFMIEVSVAIISVLSEFLYLAQSSLYGFCGFFFFQACNMQHTKLKKMHHLNNTIEFFAWRFSPFGPLLS